MPNYVAGVGPLNPQLMIVGEAPGRQENDAGIPFVGATGQLLNEYLSNAGIKRQDCYITNVVKYQPPFNDTKKLNLIGVNLGDSIRSLWDNEIDKLRPNCILAVGDVALNAVTGLSGILNYRGSILLSNNGRTKVIPTIHPAALFKRSTGSEEDESSETKGGLSWVYTKLIQADIIRAVEESRTSSLDLPYRQLDIASNSLQVYRYFEQYKSCAKAAVDIESINCIPVCIGFAFSRSHAISIPLLKQIGKNELTEMGDNELDECWRIIDTQLRRLKIIGHNYKYDDYKLGLSGFESSNVYSDTLIKTRVLFPELPDKRLSTVASLWTREPYYKEEGKEFKLGKNDISQLFKYNAKDCAVEFEVDEEQEKDLVGLAEEYKIPLVDYYYNYMMKKHKFYLNMENNGFCVDFAKKEELSTRYTKLEKEAHAKLTSLIGYDVNVKSPPQIFQLLYKAMRFKSRKLAPTSEDTIIALIGNHCKGSNGARNKEILECILEERRIRDQKSRYINFVPDYDGRCKTSYNISATETCRSSTAVVKKPLRPKKLGLSYHVIGKHGRLAKDTRSMFVPSPGYVFVQVDSSQAEARVVAVLAKDWQLLEAFDKIDIHRRTAGLVFSYTKDLILTTDKLLIVDDLDKDGPERFTGKKVRHAGNYNMGKKRFMTEFNTDAQKFDISMSISEWRAGQMLEAFHAASPNIRKVFHQDIKDAIDNNRCLIDPFGGIRIFNGRWGEEIYKEGFANIPQRTVAHLVQGAAMRAAERFDAQARFICEAHDALLIEAPANDWERYARVLKEEMEQPIDFSLYCSLRRDYMLTIPADVEFSDASYGALKKVKL